MVLYFTVTLICVALAALVRGKYTNEYGVSRQVIVNRVCLCTVFIILFALCALRIGVGNDYLTYVQNAHEINVGGITVTEYGYNAVVKLIYALTGSENYLLIFALFGFATIYIFMHAMYEQSRNFALSFFLFMTLGVYFRSFTTVRYYFVLAIALYSLKLVKNREDAKCFILIVLAAFFHKSVLFVLLAYGVCREIKTKYLAVIVAVLAIPAYAFKNFIIEFALALYPSYKDTIYLTQDVGIKENIPAILRCVLIIGICIYCFRDAVKDDKDNILYLNMSIAALGLYIALSFLPLVSRFGYYLITPQILLMPGIISKLEGKKKKIVLGITILFGLIYFIYFLLTASKAGISVLPYKTWLFDQLEWNNVEEMLMYSNR